MAEKFTLVAPLDASGIEDFKPEQPVKVVVESRNRVLASESVKLDAKGQGVARFRLDDRPPALRVLLGPADASDEDLAHLQTITERRCRHERTWMRIPLPPAEYCSTPIVYLGIHRRVGTSPYDLKKIMDCLSPASLVQRVSLMKGAQIGGTECGNCWIGYVIHQAPGPMMAVAPGGAGRAQLQAADRFADRAERGPAQAGQGAPLARQRQYGAEQGVPGRGADPDRRQQRGVRKLIHVVLDELWRGQAGKVGQWLAAIRAGISLHSDLVFLAQRGRDLLRRAHPKAAERGVFHSLVALQQAINRLVETHTQATKPFVWNSDPNAIIAAAKRGCQALDLID